jgi:nitric oxide reductase
LRWWVFLFLLCSFFTAIAQSDILQGVVELLKHPDQLKELIAKPALAKEFVNELCRYHTASAMAMKRVAKVDIELGGQVRNALCGKKKKKKDQWQY